MFEMTEYEYLDASGQGICEACGELRPGVEPDAEGYECYDCGAMKVKGIENALFDGTIDIV